VALSLSGTRLELPDVVRRLPLCDFLARGRFLRLHPLAQLRLGGGELGLIGLDVGVYLCQLATRFGFRLLRVAVGRGLEALDARVDVREPGANFGRELIEVLRLRLGHDDYSCALLS